MVKLPIVGHVMSLVRKPARKPARAAMSRDERLRLGFDAAPAGIAFATPDGHWLQANDRFRELVGYTREELARISFHSITHPEDATRETPLVRKLVAGDVASYQLEKRVMGKRGRYRTLRVTASLARSPEGEPEFFVYVVEEPPPKRADSHDGALAELLPDLAVIRTDEKGAIESWNAGAQRIFGYTADEIVGKNRRELFRDADSWQSRSTKQLQAVGSGEQMELEDWRVAKDGRHLWVKTTVAPIRAGGELKGYLEIIAPPAPVDPRKGLESTIETLRAEVEQGRRKEESLREALEEVRVMGEETMNELKIMTGALRKEIDRRKLVEEELRAVSERLVAPPEPEPEVVEEETLVALPAPRAWRTLEVPAGELLESFAEKSGTLVVASGARQVEVFFDRGRIFSCASNDPASFLAQRLIDGGVISEDNRRRALELKQHTNLALGRILLILGAIDEAQLVGAMRRKIEDALAELVAWTDARWAFVEGEVPSLQLVPLRLEVREALAPVRVVQELVASSSAKSRKYHRPDCISVRRLAPEGRLTFASAAEAEERGYGACRICGTSAAGSAA